MIETDPRPTIGPKWASAIRGGMMALSVLTLVAGIDNACGQTNSNAGLLRTQSITLTSGWNAIFLEVTPQEPLPESVFRGLPVDIVATDFVITSTAQFTDDPGEAFLKEPDWGVWYAPSREDAFLSTLDAIHGQKAYLIHATKDFAWELMGETSPPEIRWTPNAFNFVGFGVDPVGAPTFAQFFSGSKNHRLDRIYRLQGDGWRRVTDPDAEAMRAGEAFWIYCAGRSSYLGPFSATTPSHRGLVLWKSSGDLTLKNHTDHPITPRLEHVVSISLPAVPLSIVILGLDDPRLSARIPAISSVAAPKPAAAWSQDLPAIEGGSGLRIPFEARREDTVASHQSSLLKVTTDMGTVHWVPVVAGQRNLD